MPCLTLEHVHYHYRTKHQTTHAVRDADLSFEPGVFYAIIGRSGSGKTTLLSLLAGLDRPTEGRVLYDDTALGDMDISEYRLRHASVVYQSYNLFPLLTVLENVMLPLEIRKTPRKEAQSTASNALEAVGLSELFARRLPAQLSGGEQQRVAIARALASGTRILLADEPTGNLDTENGVIVMDLLQSLAHESKRCVIVVTHDSVLAERADITYRMQDGRIALAGAEA